MANPDEMPRSDPWQMRASDADREKYVSVLQNAYAEGRLSHEEYDDRMSSAYQAVTFADLYPLLTDLPVEDESLPLPPSVEHQQLAQYSAPETALSPRSVVVDSSPAVAVFSDVRRGGHWVVPAEQTSIAVMGTLKLDLRDALLESGSVRIQAVAVLGEIRIKVPDDVHLEVTGTGVFGEFIRKDKRSGDDMVDAPVGSPRVHITGAAIFGSVTVSVVASREGRSGRGFPQTDRQLDSPLANLPPPNLPPVIQPPVQDLAADGDQLRHQDRLLASHDRTDPPPPAQPPALQQPEHPQQPVSPDVADSHKTTKPGGPGEVED